MPRAGAKAILEECSGSNRMPKTNFAEGDAARHTNRGDFGLGGVAVTSATKREQAQTTSRGCHGDRRPSVKKEGNKETNRENEGFGLTQGERAPGLGRGGEQGLRTAPMRTGPRGLGLSRPGPCASVLSRTAAGYDGDQVRAGGVWGWPPHSLREP